MRPILAFTFAAIGTSLGGCVSAEPLPAPTAALVFAEVDGPGRVELSDISEEELVFRWLAPMSGDRTDCDRNGKAGAIAPPLADPEIEDGPNGAVFAGREYWHAQDSHCMLSLVLELEPAHWLRVTRLACDGRGACLPAGAWLFERQTSPGSNLALAPREP